MTSPGGIGILPAVGPASSKYSAIHTALLDSACGLGARIKCGVRRWYCIVNQNVCTVNVHEMYYKFNPGTSPCYIGRGYRLVKMTRVSGWVPLPAWVAMRSEIALQGPPIYLAVKSGQKNSMFSENTHIC
jgi:hypothetical protein